MVSRLKTLDKVVIREPFMDRFSIERMARDYLALYGTVLPRGALGSFLSSAAAT